MIKIRTGQASSKLARNDRTALGVLDRERGVQVEARNVAKSVVRAVALLRRGALARPDAGVIAPRPK